MYCSNSITIHYYPRDPVTGQVDYNKLLWSERLPKKDWNKEDKKQVSEALKINRVLAPMLSKALAATHKSLASTHKLNTK
jgi:hypothetical protein